MREDEICSFGPDFQPHDRRVSAAFDYLLSKGSACQLYQRSSVQLSCVGNLLKDLAEL